MSDWLWFLGTAVKELEEFVAKAQAALERLKERKSDKW